MDKYYHIFTTAGGIFLDAYNKAMPCAFIMYSGVKNKLDFDFQTESFVFREESAKLTLGSLDKVKEKLSALVDAAIDIFVKATSLGAADDSNNRIYTLFVPEDHANINTKLLVEQIIFDILFDKYVSESKKMTCNAYAEKMQEKFKDMSGFASRINKKIKQALETNSERITKPKIQTQLEKFGINSDKYIEYYSPTLRNNPYGEKPECIWNHLYINHNVLTDRQYRRVLDIDKNYSYDNFLTDLKDYNDYINKFVLPTEQDPDVQTPAEEYFTKTMDYYFFETYKRIDFMFKYVNTMLEVGVSEINPNERMINRFVPDVLVPYEDNGKIEFGRISWYYRPPIYIEEFLLNQIRESKKYDAAKYETIFFKYQYIRAKAYELFKSQFKYDSDDYNEIKRFISEHFNMINYHKSNAIWKTLCSFKTFNKMKDDEKRSFKNMTKKFMAVNQVLFPKSTDKVNTSPETEHLC